MFHGLRVVKIKSTKCDALIFSFVIILKFHLLIFFVELLGSAASALSKGRFFSGVVRSNPFNQSDPLTILAFSLSNTSRCFYR